MSTSSPVPGISGSDPSGRPTRRTFTAEYKARIIEEYNAAPNGEKGALVRRENAAPREPPTHPAPNPDLGLDQRTRPAHTKPLATSCCT